MKEIDIYIDGEFYPKSQAKVSVYDHGLLYGDGVFEGIRTYNGRIFRYQEHLDRLYESAHAIRIDIGLDKEEMTQAVLETLRRNNLKDSYIRLLVTRGKGDLGLDPRKCPKASVIIIADAIKLYPPETYIEGMRLTVTSTRKNSFDATSPRIKSLNYLNNIVAKMEAIDSGYQEGLMLDRHGYVTECTSENVFIIKNGVLRTPHPSAGILEGVTRNVVMELAEEMGYSIDESPMTLHDVYVADECFVTGTGAELIPIISLTGRDIGEGVPGPIFKKLLEAFRELTQKEGYPVYDEVASLS